MARNEQEDDWIDEVQHRDGFVLDEGLNALEIPDQEVTYRRANVETQFMTSRFDAMTEDLYEPSPPGKVAFTTSPATLRDLEDGSSTLLGLGPMQQKAKAGSAAPALATSGSGYSLGDEAAVASSLASPPKVFVPSSEVPDAQEVGYHQVNPMFESCKPPKEIWQTLQQALKTQDVEFSCSSDWTMDAYALVAAEELFFNVQLHRLATKSTLRVDFNLRSGDELKFLALTDLLRKDCRAIDKDMAGLPDLSFDVFADWSSPEGLFAGPAIVNSQELSLLLVEINSECPPFTRYEVARRLKELCQSDSNRRTFAEAFKDQFVAGLQSMLKDDNEDIVRFAIYAILNFAEDISTLNDLELPQLPETLQDILTLSQKPSTRKLAGDLYKTINAVC